MKAVIILMGISAGVDARLGARSAATSAPPCVFDQCPMVYIANAGTDKMNGLYSPFQPCTSPNYDNTNSGVMFDAYINTNGMKIRYYTGKDHPQGWGVRDGGHTMYYDGLDRLVPTTFVYDDWVTNKDHAKNPAPTVTCLGPANVGWVDYSSNPSATWNTTSSTSYSQQDQQTITAQTSIGASFEGITASSSFSDQTQTTVSTALSMTVSESCSNPCDNGHNLWIQSVTTQDATGRTTTMLPQCGLITCTPLGKIPKCPAQYCGGNSISDGCQCCSSNEWIDP